jgi:hypothetical protein
LNFAEHLPFSRQSERILPNLSPGNAGLRQECDSREGRNKVPHRLSLDPRGRVGRTIYVCQMRRSKFGTAIALHRQVRTLLSKQAVSRRFRCTTGENPDGVDAEDISGGIFDASIPPSAAIWAVSRDLQLRGSVANPS